MVYKAVKKLCDKKRRFCLQVGTRTWICGEHNSEMEKIYPDSR